MCSQNSRFAGETFTKAKFSHEQFANSVIMNTQIELAGFIQIGQSQGFVLAE